MIQMPAVQQSIPRDHTVIGIPASSENLQQTLATFQSLVTRNGNVYMKILIPFLGFTRWTRLKTIFCLVVAPIAIIVFIALLEKYVSSFPGLLVILCVMIIIILTLFVCYGLSMKRKLFTGEEVKITRMRYRLYKMNISWCSFFCIMWFPWQLNDLESGEVIKREEMFEDRRSPRVNAEIVVTSQNNLHEGRGHVRLGLIGFGYRLSLAEREWLTNEINIYLQDS